MSLHLCTFKTPILDDKNMLDKEIKKILHICTLLNAQSNRSIPLISAHRGCSFLVNVQWCL